MRLFRPLLSGKKKDCSTFASALCLVISVCGDSQCSGKLISNFGSLIDKRKTANCHLRLEVLPELVIKIISIHCEHKTESIEYEEA